MKLAPVLLFTYKRLAQTRQTVSSLQQNMLADKSELFIFSDGPKGEQDILQVQAVRDYLHTLSGFKKITIIESVVNKGLAGSVITGVTQVINEYGNAIVLEDDLLLAPNFLVYMNAALAKYENEPKVYSISGFIFELHHDVAYEYDVFFTRRHCSWGWAIWKDRWNEIDWQVGDYGEFERSPAKQAAFNGIGSDLGSMLNKQMTGKLDSWAIRCIYHQFKNGSYTAYPLTSKVINIGFGEGATHTHSRFNKYDTTLDKGGKAEFSFPDRVFEEKHLIKQFRQKYSLPTRVYYYALNRLVKMLPNG